MARVQYSKGQVLEAIKGSMGNVSHIARVLDCDWHTARKYTQRWAETRQAYEDETERSLDFTESQMLKAIKNGDGPMIRFHLMTKGKERGYTQRQEVTGADGEALRIEYVNHWRNQDA